MTDVTAYRTATSRANLFTKSIATYKHLPCNNFAIAGAGAVWLSKSNNVKQQGVATVWDLPNDMLNNPSGAIIPPANPDQIEHACSL